MKIPAFIPLPAMPWQLKKELEMTQINSTTMLICLILCVAVLQLSSCSGGLDGQGNYEPPAKVCELPLELIEISGLANIDGKTLACVQDELGDVFFYDIENCKIINRITFEGPGDYEGMAKAGNDLFALRSDGLLFRIQGHDDGEPVVTKIHTSIPAGDNEGICFDERNNRLILTPKQKYADKDFGKNFRAVYAYDLARDEMIEEPVLQISVEEVLNFLQQESDIELPSKKKSGKAKFKFHISSITIHPLSGLYYLLISSERLVLAVDEKGKPMKAIPLNEKVLPKPEGIAFLDADVMAISSEGQGGTPVIALFNL